MHYHESHGFHFNYNGDYSGVIHVSTTSSPTVETNFPHLVSIATDSHAKPLIPFVNVAGEHVYVDREAIRNFVAHAALLLVTSKLEDMTADELMSKTFVKSTLGEAVGKMQKDKLAS